MTQPIQSSKALIYTAVPSSFSNSSALKDNISNLLPLELLVNIFFNLDFSSLLNCQRVCRLWRNVYYMVINSHEDERWKCIHDRTFRNYSEIFGDWYNRLCWETKTIVCYRNEYLGRGLKGIDIKFPHENDEQKLKIKGINYESPRSFLTESEDLICHKTVNSNFLGICTGEVIKVWMKEQGLQCFPLPLLPIDASFSEFVSLPTWCDINLYHNRFVAALRSDGLLVVFDVLSRKSQQFDLSLCHDKPAIPAENDVKSLNVKDNNEKSLRKEILQPIDSQTEKPSAGIADDKQQQIDFESLKIMEFLDDQLISLAPKTFINCCHLTSGKNEILFNRVKLEKWIEINEKSFLLILENNSFVMFDLETGRICFFKDLNPEQIPVKVTEIRLKKYRISNGKLHITYQGKKKKRNCPLKVLNRALVDTIDLNSSPHTVHHTNNHPCNHFTDVIGFRLIDIKSGFENHWSGFKKTITKKGYFFHFENDSIFISSPRLSRDLYYDDFDSYSISECEIKDLDGRNIAQFTVSVIDQNHDSAYIDECIWFGETILLFDKGNNIHYYDTSLSPPSKCATLLTSITDPTDITFLLNTKIIGDELFLQFIITDISDSVWYCFYPKTKAIEKILKCDHYLFEGIDLSEAEITEEHENQSS